MTAATVLLPRLSNVRRFGNGWRADCPVGHSSLGALSIAECDDGAVLLHCFAGCPAFDVLNAVGLNLSDLFPKRPRDDCPERRRAVRVAFRQSGWGAALSVLAMESTVIAVAAESMIRGELRMSRDDVDRIHLADSRIHDAREVLHGR